MYISVFDQHVFPYASSSHSILATNVAIQFESK